MVLVMLRARFLNPAEAAIRSVSTKCSPGSTPRRFTGRASYATKRLAELGNVDQLVGFTTQLAVATPSAIRNVMPVGSAGIPRPAGLALVRASVGK